MTPESRYRTEGGKHCIDILLRSSHQLFDRRDPAPFRERDIDDEAVEYILGATEEIRHDASLKIVLQITDEPEPHLEPVVIHDALLAHFTYLREMIARRLLRQRRRAYWSVAIGLVVLGVFVTLAELTYVLPASQLRGILREGLVIIAWVGLWRPVEALLYDWWPLVDERKRIGRLLAAEIEVRYVRSDRS
jgi:hypothetical protein